MKKAVTPRLIFAPILLLGFLRRRVAVAMYEQEPLPLERRPGESDQAYRIRRRNAATDARLAARSLTQPPRCQ